MSSLRLKNWIEEQCRKVKLHLPNPHRADRPGRRMREYVEYGDGISPEIREQNRRVCEISTSAIEASTRVRRHSGVRSLPGGYLWIIP